ncbi:DUF484 family protein [Paludibacterium yongneupense]|uniref:DUF484 family protein n=1 Tax=Paludibacterium yongneupense TaxID=400061 RepID=UPI00041F3FB7|nr:DUF484 family protein [Paludibacterium yongneupense]
MQSDDVLAFLENHPDFLTHHADRFGLKPGSHDRVVVSLVDRQLLELKDKNRQQEARLAQLLRHGEANDLIQLRSHKLALALVRASTPEALLQVLPAALSEQFGLDRSALRLWHPAAEVLAAPAYTARLDIRSLARNLSAPYCGPYANDEVLSWFPPMPVLQSFSQLALRDDRGEAFGILVLASEDPERFTFDMHTHYLAQIGDLIAAAWLRILDRA